MKNLIAKITKTKTGLKPLSEDNRDLGFNIFFLGYKPKHIKKELKNDNVKKQSYNTCGWAASAGSKEIDEKTKLSTRFLVIMGKIKGYISRDGFSNLRDNEKVLKEFGIAEERFLTENSVNWKDYSNFEYLTEEMKKNALAHKTKTYWRIYKTNEIYKAIDDGRTVKIGVDWYTRLNMSRGFKYPWIYKIIGWFVGGHAMYIRGYNLQYKGQKVFIVRNSFGKKYGDNGDLYILEKDLQKQINKYGAFVNLDMEIDIAKWLINHQGRIVKTENNPDVYLIQGDKKRSYVDEATLTAHGKSISEITIVPNEYLDKIKRGKDINFWDGGNVKQIKELLRQHNNLKELYKKYFNELF